MRYTLLMILLVGCARSGATLTDDIDCGEGTRVVVQYEAFCIFEANDKVECPDELPNIFGLGEVLICAEFEDTDAAHIRAAVERSRNIERPDVGVLWDADIFPDFNLSDSLVRP